MATEDLAPDAILSSTDLSGAVGDIDEPPASYDANWMVATNNNVDTDCRVSFPTPTDTPAIGDGWQNFVAAVREFDVGQTGTPVARLELWENGTLVRAGTDEDVISQGQQITFTWNANELGTADGSLVECNMVGSSTGGSPRKRNTVDLGAIEWQVYAAEPNTLQPDGLSNVDSDWSGSLSDIDDPVTLPGSDYLTASQNEATAQFFKVTFPTPPSDLKVGANLQKFSIYTKRRGTVYSPPTIVMKLLENANVKATSSAINVTATGGEIIDFTWDATSLSFVSGLNVEMWVEMTANGTSSPYDVADIGGITWTYALDTGSPDLGMTLKGG